MGAVVLDSSIVIAAGVPADAHHARATESLRNLQLAGHDFVIPTSVLAEVLVRPARRGMARLQHRREEIESAFGAARHVDDTVAIQAALLRAQHRSLRLPDALVIATGIVDDADAILTTDKRWQSVDDRVRVLG